MKTTITKFYPKSLLKNIQISWSLVLQIMLLMMLGMLAVVLHAKLRMPMQIPGRHGLLFMALMMGGKLATQQKYAARISTLAAGFLLLTPYLEFKDPFMALVILLPGLSIDFLYNSCGKLAKNMLIVGLIGGVSYMLIPLARVIISLFTGIQHGSLVAGFLYPTFTHFVFGATGSLFAYALVVGAKKLAKKTDQV